VEIIIFIGLVAFFWYRSNKKQQRKAATKFSSDIAKEQKRYDDYMESLPSLVGDESFSQEVRGEQAYKEMLDNFGYWLEENHPGENVIWVILELEPENIHDPSAIRIETGQTTVGYIPREEAQAFRKELLAIGGKARCSAKFYFDPNGNRSSLTLDVVRPLSAGVTS
jgi:hypothetical protein